jgi:hypothetical protein
MRRGRSNKALPAELRPEVRSARGWSDRWSQLSGAVTSG